MGGGGAGAEGAWTMERQNIINDLRRLAGSRLLFRHRLAGLAAAGRRLAFLAGRLGGLAGLGRLGFLLGGLGLLGLGGLAPLPAAAATAAGRRADCLRMFVVWHKIPSLSQAGQARRAVSPSGCGTRYNSVFPRRGPC